MSKDGKIILVKFIFFIRKIKLTFQLKQYFYR